MGFPGSLEPRCWETACGVGGLGLGLPISLGSLACMEVTGPPRPAPCSCLCWPCCLVHPTISGLTQIPDSHSLYSALVWGRGWPHSLTDTSVQSPCCLATQCPCVGSSPVALHSFGRTHTLREAGPGPR